MRTVDLVRFFDAKVSPGCPTCGKKIWEIPVATVQPGLASLSDEKQAATIGLGHPIIQGGLLGGFTSDEAVYAICKNCGFIRLHSKAVIEEWLKS